MKIIGFNGSPRKTGNTAAIMKSLLQGAQEAGAHVENIHLRSYHIEGCIGCERCRKDKTCTQFFDGMHLLYPKLIEADGIILGSPTYNYNVTPWMKAFIDRLYPFFDFTEPRPGPYTSRLADRGKRALVFGVCEQVDPKEMGYTIVSMQDAIAALGYGMSEPLAFPAHFGPQSASKSEKEMERARKAGFGLVQEFHVIN
ncbi:MAG: flavodoxin family protein [Sphaerochaeta sp.]|nr:flavodoxin family protein [Sphaerochaeta sp.]PKL28107.1 MAG: flavodoxin family protein [Spirochaetae bacterium HGW-Spirochaetae-2]